MPRTACTLLGLLLLVSAMQPAMAGEATREDDTDVAGPLDLVNVGLRWSRKKFKVRWQTEDAFTVGDLGPDPNEEPPVFRGVFEYSMLTGPTKGGFAYRYSVLATGYGTELWARLTGGPIEDEFRARHDVRARMLDGHTLVVSFKRSLLEDSEKGKRFKYNFETSYYSDDGPIFDFVPNEGDTFAARF